ncbi:hypothetical protein GQ53DRAFT_837893 [Thozetella sp. PMI_491]|nr:hypothetical protein GQ53DRAFT_837893 [Thozetella sp. PMI_491]
MRSEDADGPLRLLEPRWNWAMIAASMAISLLGAFTSTQLMCQARMSLRFSTVFLWALLSSLVFGFCSIWSLHEVAMLAFVFDLPIQVDGPRTVLSAVLAVSFTFMAVSADLLWDRYWAQRAASRPGGRFFNHRWLRRGRLRGEAGSPSATPLLPPSGQASERPGEDGEDGEDDIDGRADQGGAIPESSMPPTEAFAATEEELAAWVSSMSGSLRGEYSEARDRRVGLGTATDGDAAQMGLGNTSPLNEQNYQRSQSSSETSFIRRSLTGDSNSGSLGLSSVAGIMQNVGAHRQPSSFSGIFTWLLGVFQTGCTLKNLVKGFVWSTAVTSMHYVGIFALRIPGGYYVFNHWLVMFSALISWAVCTIGCILMATMETYLPQQVMFSILAAAGVGGMHFTGMAATTFWSTAPPSDERERGYPPELAGAVVGIAFMTCIIANVLLAHAATVSRNKLAEIVWTRKELWKTIALKEHAEAAARARGEFIASASHEIRTPLHHLQGYSDLLAQTELTEEGRGLLISIQRATKTLSLITNNVLDWSRFEQDAEESHRPTALDIRSACESIIVLLPNLDEESNVRLYVSVSPNVPKTLFLDETWLHRIFMNLLSNAMKFTKSGYIMLSVAMRGDDLIVVVRDTGCGLDPDFIPEMWAPFKQGEIRGSARGTGLGLSIIKQLLGKMKGTISVDSKYEHIEEFGPENSGSTFTIAIPTASTGGRSMTTETESSKPRVAILSGGEHNRAMEGVRICWEDYGFDVTMASGVSDLGQEKWKYVWAELDCLTENPSLFQELLHNESWLVLVPMDTHDSLESLPGILKAPHFVMLHRPLVWHTFEKRILASLDRGRHGPNGPSRALRFAAEVEVLEGGDTGKQRRDEQVKSKPVVLLVEDNPINQKLGEKMLVALGCQVLIGFDGQDGIEQLTKHDKIVDLVLVDHSMPRKDGLAATKEIRELEATGVLSHRRPIIAVTAVVNSQVQGCFKEAGADDFLAKPLSLDKLRDTLYAYLPRR